MSNMVVLDGREGEGGGQVLRSALSLSLITGRPFRLEHVRARRSSAGLKAQHLTCVSGAAAISAARVDGARVGSEEIEFHPKEVSTEPRTFEVGTAGSTSLLLQCLAYPLALAGGGELTLRGGTHVAMSPSFDYLERVWVPMLRHYGLEVTLTIEVAGFFPQGGGSIRAELAGVAEVDESDVELEPPGALRHVEVLSTVGGLPLEIASRQNAAVAERLGREGLRCEDEVRSPTVRHSRGSSVLIWTSLESGLVAGASSLGEKGLRAEEVGITAAEAFLAFLDSGGSVDEHQGDQLLLPAALAAAGFLGPVRSTHFTAQVLSPHLTAHASVIEQFLDVAVDLDGQDVLVRPSA